MTPAARIDLPALIDSGPIGRLQLSVAVLCGAVMLLDGLNTQVIGYLGPALSKDWHLSRSVLAPVFSAGLAGMMAGLLLIGPLSDKIGRRRATTFSTLSFGCFTLLTATAYGFTGLVIYRIAAGIGLGGAIPSALALAGEYCPKRRRGSLLSAGSALDRRRLGVRHRTLCRNPGAGRRGLADTGLVQCEYLQTSRASAALGDDFDFDLPQLGGARASL